MADLNYNGVSGGSDSIDAEADNSATIGLLNTNILDKMVAESLKEINSDDDTGDVGSDDELMRELEEMAGGGTDAAQAKPEVSPQKSGQILSITAMSMVEILKKRIEMYRAAEANATLAGESAKVRRFNRGIKKLNELLAQTSSGEDINAGDMPPEVLMKCTGTKSEDNLP